MPRLKTLRTPESSVLSNLMYATRLAIRALTRFPGSNEAHDGFSGSAWFSLEEEMRPLKCGHGHLRFDPPKFIKDGLSPRLSGKPQTQQGRPRRDGTSDGLYSEPSTEKSLAKMLIVPPGGHMLTRKCRFPSNPRPPKITSNGLGFETALFQSDDL